MTQPLFKGADRLQEMADMENPQQAEEDRAKVFMDRLPHVQAASRRLQGQLDIHGDQTWPLPPLPEDPNPFVIEKNAIKIRAALENCKDFAVLTNRESGKLEFLDVIAKYGKKRVVMQTGQAPPEIRLTSFEDEKKASETEAPRAIARMMEEGHQEELKELEDEGMSGESGKTIFSENTDQTPEVPSTPKSLFHSAGPSPAPTASQPSQGSNAVADEDEDVVSASQGSSSDNTLDRLRRHPRFRGIGPNGWPEFDPSPTPDSLDRSDASGATPEWLYRENATPNPYYDSDGNSIPYNTPTASNDDQEISSQSYETGNASAASEHIPTVLAPPSRELEALSVHDSEVGATPSMIDDAVAVLNNQEKEDNRETSPGEGESMSDGPKAQDKGKGKARSSSLEGDSSYASHNQQHGQGKQTTSVFKEVYKDNGDEQDGKTTDWAGKKLDVAASLRNHSVTYLDEIQPKAKERNPPVPQPENMPQTLTEAICNYIPLEAKSILTLTLERVDPPIPCPTDRRCILLKHFEIGLDGVEGLCQGTAKIPETPAVTAERERRVGKIGTFKQGDGGFYRSLKSAQQKDQQYGKGYWYFFGVKFKQTSKERKLRRGGKFLLFGAPIEAVYHLDIKRSQENVAVLLGGGVDKSGTAIKPFKANFKRTHTLFSRGGAAPMDIWPGGQDWDDGVFKDIRAAMANNGLRVGFLYADTQTFAPRPSGFPAAGKIQGEKKRKQSGPEMTEEEMKAMEKSIKPKKLSDEDIGAILAMSVLKDRAKQDAAARSK